MKVSEQERRLHDAQGHKLGFLAAALGAFAIAAAICNGAMPTPATPESVWPTQEWRTSSPEEEGMDSKELAKLIDWGIGRSFVAHSEVTDKIWTTFCSIEALDELLASGNRSIVIPADDLALEMAPHEEPAPKPNKPLNIELSIR